MASAPYISGQLIAPAALVRQLLEWVALRPRTYRETMDAWRTSCPRLPVWEDAVDNGLVEITANADEGGRVTVALTARGRAALASGALQGRVDVVAGEESRQDAKTPRD